MAKSLRSKREKRLRTLRREIAEPFYDKKEAAKLAAQAAALAAPPLQKYDVEMSDEGNNRSKTLLKPLGTISKKKKLLPSYSSPKNVLIGLSPMFGTNVEQLGSI
ncbi:unnamed protein product [Miscanthus lutarioriparius]|uniref:Uncharacterized protein n=1 Tax=Miscanthus lutarioriparius TaxID=422564 RepID=A0A811QKG0_9POAL|nr:unnamed protein product [Miscanthus lutarioriparius]